MTKRLSTDFQTGTIIERYKIIREMLPDPHYGRKLEMKCIFCGEIVQVRATQLRGKYLPKCNCKRLV